MPPVKTSSSKRRERVRPTREETRARVVQAAFEVFSRKGIAAATLDEVAAHAGLTKGAVYSSFSGKDELVLTIMEEHVARRYRAALEAVDRTADFGSGVQEAGAVLFAALREDEAWHRMLAEYVALSRNDAALAEGLRRSRVEARRAVEAVLRGVFAERGIEPPMPVPELALALFAVSNGLGMEMAMDPDAPGDSVFGQVLGLIFRDVLG